MNINILIVFKIEFKTNLKFYFVSYNAKNNILSLKILFDGYNEVKELSNDDSDESWNYDKNKHKYKKLKQQYKLSNK